MSFLLASEGIELLGLEFILAAELITITKLALTLLLCHTIFPYVQELKRRTTNNHGWQNWIRLKNRDWRRFALYPKRLIEEVVLT
jgi:hypothetical protein